MRTSVIQWWATWPASEQGEDAGTVLSDRALLRLEQGGALDSEISPAALYPALEQDWSARRARVRDRARAAVLTDTPADIASIIERSAALDATIAELAAEPALARVDLQVVYLPGLDIAQHALFAANAETAAAAPSAVAARVLAIERYCQFLDGLVGDLTRGGRADLTRDRRAVLLVTQPGRVALPGSGIMALTGTPERVGATGRTEGAVTSVAATALYLLGMPIAADLAGALPTTLIAENFLREHPARTVSTYGARRIAPRRITGKPLDQEMIERMRSLGYVK